MRDELNILDDFPATPHKEWLAAVEKQLKGKPFEKALVKKTYEGIGIQPMYFKHDLEDLPHVDAMPGFVPYVRGNRASGNRVNAWQIAQEIGEPAPESLNAALARDLKRGQTAINLRLDRAARAGQNPDAAASADVGALGVSLASTADVAAIFQGIDPVQYPIQIDAGIAPAAIAALVAAYVQQEGHPVAELEGCIAADPIKELVLNGSITKPLEASYAEMAGLTRWAAANAPKLKTIAVHGSVYREAGGNAVQEIAFALATGVAAIGELQERGLAIDDICPRIQFNLAIGPDFFMEIAKFRAARMVWQRIAEAFGADEESRKMVIHASTLQYNKTKVDPWVNMLRVTTEAFSGIAGGCDSLHVGPFDEVIRTPNDFSRRIARNVQIIFKNEAHFDKVVDPAGGSWYVETITLELAKQIWALFQQVEAKGGIVAALQEGYPQVQVAEIAGQRAKSIATRKDRIVGTNMYPNLTEKPLDVPEFDHAAFQKDRAEQVAAFQKTVDAQKVKAALEALAAVGDPADSALVDRCIEAALAGATLGELTAGIGAPANGLSVEALRTHRAAEPFEDLRRTTEAFVAQTGKAPTVFMANLGPLARHKPRSDFSTAFFNVAAIETLFNEGFATPDEAADAALASGARAVVICGTDDDYLDAVPPITRKIKAADAGMMVIVAGYSPNYVDDFKQAGVDDFIHLRANALAILKNLQQHLMQPKGVSE